MKRNILIALSSLLIIITLCGFIISYHALLTTALDSGIDASWGLLKTKYIWPLTVDFALITFEIALFYVTLYEPKQKPLMILLVLAFVMLTVYFNVIHGLPETWPVTRVEWMKASESVLAWILPPVVQCLGVLTLAKIFSGLVNKKDKEPVKDNTAALEAKIADLTAKVDDLEEAVDVDDTEYDDPVDDDDTIDTVDLEQAIQNIPMGLGDLFTGDNDPVVTRGAARRVQQNAIDA